MTWSVTADPARFDEAVDWFLRRNVVTADLARAINDRAKADAFWVGGGLQLAQVQRVFDEIGKALEKGTPFEEWRKAVRDTLKNDAHAETVFRNAAQRSYNTGRWYQMTEPSVQRFRPFWMFDAVLDTRTTPICNALGKPPTILAADDPFWDSRWPPLHHRCRSSIRNLRRSEAERRGITPRAPDDVPPSGWGQSPRQNPPPPKPKVEKTDPALLAELERKARERKPRRPRPKAEHQAEFWEPRYKQQYGDAAPALAWGKAAEEYGLDLPLADVDKELRRLAFLPHVEEARQRVLALQLTSSKDSTLREHGVELDPELRAYAALAGHLKRIRPHKKPLSVPDLEADPIGRRALRFYSEASNEATVHPTYWNFVKTTERASASTSKKKIEWNTGEGVLEHEWAHALEALNSKLKRRAEAYLRARTKGETPRKLKALQPTKAYEDHEVTKEDGFIDPYIGKWYESGGNLYATELTSMGAELLVAGRRHWGTLKRLSEEDPETLRFVLGQLANP